MGKKLFFNILKFVIFLSIGIALIWFITKDLTTEQKSQLRESFRSANYWWVALSILIGIFSHYIRALRWKMMLKPLGYNPRMKTTFYAVMIAYLINMAVPRLGEVTRCGIIQRYEKVPFDKALGTWVVERSIDLVLLFLATFLLFVTQFTLIYNFFYEKVIVPISEKIAFSTTTIIIIITIVIAFVLIVWFLIKKFKHTEAYLRLKIMMMNVRDGVYSIRHLKNFKLFIFYSVLIWVCYFLMVYVCFFAIEQTTHFGLAQALAVLVFGTVGIISTPGGIGAYQLIVTETLASLYGLDRTYAISFSWLAWSAQTIMIIFIGVISLLLLSRTSRNEIIDEKV